MKEALTFLLNTKTSEEDFMNFLQDWAYISDSCVNLKDVHEGDWEETFKCKDFFNRFRKFKSKKESLSWTKAN